MKSGDTNFPNDRQVVDLADQVFRVRGDRDLGAQLGQLLGEFLAQLMADLANDLADGINPHLGHFGQGRALGRLLPLAQDTLFLGPAVLALLHLRGGAFGRKLLLLAAPGLLIVVLALVKPLSPPGDLSGQLICGPIEA